MSIGGQSFAGGGSAVRTCTYPAELTVKVDALRAALLVLSDGVGDLGQLDSVQLGYLARDVRRLYPTLDHIVARVDDAHTARAEAERAAIVVTARGLMLGGGS